MPTSVQKSWAEALLSSTEYVFDGNTYQGDKVIVSGTGVTVTQVEEGVVGLDINGGGGGGGGLIVEDQAELTALDSDSLDDGTEVYVMSYRCHWRLHKGTPTFSTVPNEIVFPDDSEVSQWVRQNDPDVYWVNQSGWFVSPGGNDENDGYGPETPLQSVREFLRRVTPNLRYAKPLTINVYIRGDLMDEGGLFIQANADVTPENGCVINFIGDLSAMTPVTSGTITALTLPNKLTDTHGTITSTTSDFAGFAGCVGVVRGGARDGARFVIAEALSTTQARIGNVGGAEYYVVPVNLQIGDEFDVYDPFLLADNIVVVGFGAVGFQLLGIGNPGGEGSDPGHSFAAYGARVAFDACRILNGVNSYASAYVDVVTSWVTAGARAQDHAELVLSGCVVQDASPIARTGGSLWSYNATIEGTVRVEALGAFHVAPPDIDSDWWCSWANCETAVDVFPGGKFIQSGGAVSWGTGVIGPRIKIRPDAAYYVSSNGDTHIQGSGVEIAIGTTNTTFSAMGDVDDNFARCLLV